jgi:23S rRNA (pseudouridine1915-N3)-methyltransferase
MDGASQQGAAMRLTVVQTGRIRDAHLTALRDEYVKRFARFGKLQVVEIEPKAKASLWPASARWRVALDERGEALTSEALAARLAEWTMRHGEIAFLVGDAYGHHPPSLAEAQARLSLGPLTLPHQFAHLVLVEQLYRAATITAGTPYHHGG